MAAFLALFANPASSHDPNKELRKFRLQHWDSQNGLNAFNIFCILQSADGYLWMATDIGLVRFDGVSFTVFDESNVPLLRQRNVSSLTEGPDSTLYFGMRGGGILAYRMGRFFRPAGWDKIPTQWVFSLCADSSNALWVGTRGYGLGKLVNGVYAHYTQYAPGDTLTGHSVNTISPGKDGKLYFGMGVPGYVFEDRTVLYPPTVSQLVFSVYQDHTGKVWVGTSYGLSSIHNGEFAVDAVNAKLLGSPVRAVIEDRDGNLWIGSEGEGLFRIANGVLSRLTMEDGLRSNRIESLYEDRQGNIWIGTRGGGLSKLSDQLITMMTKLDRLPGDEISTVLQASDGTRWVGTRNNGVAAVEGPRAGERYDSKNGLTSEYVRSLAEAADGTLFIGTSLTVHKLSPVQGKGGPRLSSLPFQNRSAARAEAFTPDGALWIGTYGPGLLRYAEGRLDSFPATMFRGDQGFVRTVAARPDNSVWMGSQGGVTHMSKDRVLEQYFIADGLSEDQIFSLLVDSAGIVWVGTYGGGLSRIDHGKISKFSRVDGLFDDVVFSIIDDGLGRFWMSSNRGIFRVDIAELNAFARGEVKSIHSISYGTEDGMISVECNGGSQPSAMRMSDGRIWFATMKGVAVVDPSRTQPGMRPPEIRIEYILAERETIHAGPNVTLPLGAREFEVKYTGIEYFSPDKIQFRYRLDRNDNHWNEAGTRRRAFYTNLSPGTYTFSLDAANKHNIWNPVPTAMTITVPPFVWETWWFRGGVSAVVIASLIAFVRIRERRIKTEAQKKAELQQQISELEARALRAQMNPHFIFNALNAIQECVLTGSTELACEYLSKFARLLRTTLEHSGKSSVSLDREIDALRYYLELESLRFDGRFLYTIEVDPVFESESFLVPAMLIQPFVENAIWHGLLHKDGDRQLLIKLEMQGDVMLAVVQDNGIGRAQAAALKSQKKEQHESMGMRVTRERLEMLGRDINRPAGVQFIDLTGDDAQPAGTRVEITIPLSQ